MSFLKSAFGLKSKKKPSDLPFNLFDIGEFSRSPRWANEAAIRSLCKVAYLGGSTALCRMLGRYKIYVDTQDFGVAPHLMLDGYWEMWLTEIIAQRVKPGMVVADIGANIGYYTLLMAELVGATGRVHAFEPNPLMVQKIAQSVSINGFLNVSIHNVALAEHEGEEMVFIVPPNEPKNAHILPYDGAPLQPGTILQTHRLDSPAWPDIEFAKIDVEGAEQLIWAGAKGLLDNGKLKTVALEFTGGRYADAGSFLDRLLAPGFSLSYVDMRKGLLPLTREDVLAHNPNEDLLLYLQR
jgi:FkbM family methyltransferase